MEGESLRNSLLSAISHDLRTPLTALVGLASTLTNQDPPEQVRKELAHAIHSEAQQMSELVTNLLDMARLQVGGVQLKKDWQSIEEIVGSSVARFKNALAGHQLVVAIPMDLPLCECDPVLMQRVIVNLLDNAAKYSPPSSTISISSKALDETMTLVVEDDGFGLPLGQETQLFDKFMRGETESNKPGIGLGLALCKVIVEAHGGTITAENRAPKGARFIVSLPLTAVPMPAMLEKTPLSSS
jgi:two-component system sensor histidine kinase KdpD